MWDEVVGRSGRSRCCSAPRRARSTPTCSSGRAARASRPRPGASPRLLIGADDDDRVLRGRHPDVVEFRPVATMYSVERDVRAAILPAVHASPIETERKCVVLLEADRLNPESSNTLLKSIEEPPRAHDHHPRRRVRGRAARHDPVALPAGRLRRARDRGAARRARAARGARGAVAARGDARRWAARSRGRAHRSARRAARRVRRRPRPRRRHRRDGASRWPKGSARW